MTATTEPGEGGWRSPAWGGADPARVAELADRAHELAGSEGIPEAFQALADRLPEATCGSALYALGVGVSLAIGDLAAALDQAAASATPQSHAASLQRTAAWPGRDAS